MHCNAPTWHIQAFKPLVDTPCDMCGVTAEEIMAAIMRSMEEGSAICNLCYCVCLYKRFHYLTDKNSMMGRDCRQKLKITQAKMLLFECHGLQNITAKILVLKG